MSIINGWNDIYDAWCASSDKDLVGPPILFTEEDAQWWKQLRAALKDVDLAMIEDNLRMDRYFDDAAQVHKLREAAGQYEDGCASCHAIQAALHVDKP